MPEQKETVFIVRDVEERYLQGVYRHHLDALEAIEARVDEMIGDEEGEEEREYCRDSYEIVEMPLE